MLSTSQKEIVIATVPVLRQSGETITRVFYRNMFEAHPELYNLFNPANQRDGAQQRSLAAAVLAYAEHINPQFLGKMLERIESKHVSLEVKPEHYPIVGKYLLGAIQEVLGTAATAEILDAWSAAYGQLADLMIAQEAEHYAASSSMAGEWRGFKSFRVDRKVLESEVMSSFYLVPEDGAPLPPFRAGQFLSVQVHPPDFAITTYASTAFPAIRTASTIASAYSARLRRRRFPMRRQGWFQTTSMKACRMETSLPSTCPSATSC